MSDTSDHVHRHCWDEATRPDRNGRITVTERCDCGATIRIYDTWIL